MMRMTSSSVWLQTRCKHFFFVLSLSHSFKKKRTSVDFRKTFQLFLKVICLLPGRVSFFSSGSENVHRVERVTWGTRYAITVSFTCDPAHAISDPALP